MQSDSVRLARAPQEARTLSAALRVAFLNQKALLTLAGGSATLWLPRGLPFWLLPWPLPWLLP